MTAVCHVTLVVFLSTCLCSGSSWIPVAAVIYVTIVAVQDPRVSVVTTFLLEVVEEPGQEVLLEGAVFLELV